MGTRSNECKKLHYSFLGVKLVVLTGLGFCGGWEIRGEVFEKKLVTLKTTEN